MLFKFLKYLQPTHYFTLKRLDGSVVFPDPNNFSSKVKDKILKDQAYSSEEARTYDMAWQALQKGYIGDTKLISISDRIPLKDEYVFIRKYFSSAWVLYVIFLRLLSFKNPFKEISAWYNTKHVKRSDYLQYPINYKDWKDYNSKLILENPKISVIIPTLNRYHYLKDALNDLEHQNYRNFEVIIIDQSEPFKKEFYGMFNLDIKVFYQNEKALWLARNKAIKESLGEYLLLFDDDSRVKKDWISNHLKCLEFFKADISSGVSISKIGDNVPQHYSFFKISDQLDTGNVLIKRDVFKKIGLFDRQFEKQRMGDGEFGLRAYLNGFKNISNPEAKRLHLKGESGGLREFGAWDAYRPKHWLGSRPIPSVLYYFRQYYGGEATKFAMLRMIPISMFPYHFKANKTLKVIGVLICIIILPLIMFQLAKSWHLASKKIKQGRLIDILN